MPGLFENAVQYHIGEDGNGAAHNEHPPLDNVQQPHGDKHGQRHGHHRDDGDGDNDVHAVAAGALLGLLSGGLPAVVVGEQIVHADAEDLRHLQQHIGVGYGLAPLPLGYGLIGIIQLRAKLRLGQFLFRAQLDDIAGRNQFKL